MNIGIVISPSHLIVNQSIRKQLPEPMFYEQLIEYGRKQHIDVYVFRATDFNSEKNCLMGYCFEHGQWSKQSVPLPDIIIDRTFHSHKLMFKKHALYMNQLEKKHRFIYFNANLPNKLQVFEQLKGIFPTIIPPSMQYEHFLQLDNALDEYKAGIILKPVSGMHGKGIVHVTKKDRLYCILGRQLNNQLIATTFSSSIAFQKWLLYFRKNHAYLLQPYYQFRTTNNEPFDIRVMMQKDGNGKWKLSGSMARVGNENSLTSNLHGGGKSSPVFEVLNKRFDNDKAAHLLDEIHMISGQIVEQIEASFGRFGELALDFGINDTGNIFLLECNSKPGRQAFLNDKTSTAPVIEQPIDYAQYLYHHYIQNKNVYHYKSTSII